MHAPPPGRNAEIYSKRRAGKTLRELGQAYGLSIERIRHIVRRLELTVNRESGISARSEKCIKLMLGDYSLVPGFNEDAKTIAKKIATIGRAGFEANCRCMNRTLDEIEAWLNKYNLTWTRRDILKGY
jgi:hypothetical protein